MPINRTVSPSIFLNLWKYDGYFHKLKVVEFQRRFRDVDTGEVVAAHLIKIVVEVKALGPPHVLELGNQC